MDHVRDSVTRTSRLRQVPTDRAAWQEFVGRYGEGIYDWCRKWNLQDSDAQHAWQDLMRGRLQLSAGGGEP